MSRVSFGTVITLRTGITQFKFGLISETFLQLTSIFISWISYNTQKMYCETMYEVIFTQFTFEEWLY